MPETKPVDTATSRYNAAKRHYIRKRAYAQAFQEAGYPDVAAQLRDCHETEQLAACSHCGKSWYVPNRCRLRVCPLCSWDVAKKRASILIGITRCMKYPKLLTLTMPTWTADPRDGIKHLRSSFARLRRTKLFRHVRGGAYQIELKHKPTGWHIHIHVLLDAPFIPYQQIFSKWREIAKVDVPQIDIRAARTPEQCAYVCKYAAKSANFYTGADIVVQWYLATKGQRLFATFGKWYRCSKAEVPEMQLLEKFEAVCPFCQAKKSTYLARDGPFIFSGKDWQTLSITVMGDNDEIRVLDNIRDDLINTIEENGY